MEPSAAHLVASEPPIGSLFSAFLGFNPIRQLLGPTGALEKLSPHQLAYITGRSFFPNLISEPFAGGLHLAFTFAAVATLFAIVASALRGKRYFYAPAPLAEELAEGAADSGAVTGLDEAAEVAELEGDRLGGASRDGNGRLAGAGSEELDASRGGG